MNKDIFEGKWKEIKGHIKEQWGDLTDDELKEAEGSFDKFQGALQKKYGYDKETAKKKINDFLKTYKYDNYDDKHG